MEIGLLLVPEGSKMRRSLNYIIRVAECGNISRAAEELYITTSGLSKFILARERELGVDLFDRSGKKFTLTLAGEKYINWARKIVSMLDSMENEITSISQEKAGLMHFGVQIMQSKYLLTHIIPDFEKEYPHIDLIIDTSYIFNKLMKQLEVGMIDFVISSHYLKKNEMQYLKIGEIEIALIVPKGHPKAETAIEKKGFKYPWVDLRLFENEHFISLYKEQEPGRLTESLFEMHHIKPHIKVKVPTSEMSVLGVVNGLGLTIGYDLPAKFIDYADKVELLSFGDAPMKRDISIIFRKDYSPKTFETAFFNLCKDYLN